MLLIFAITALVATASSTPVGTKTIDANFDDLTSNPLLPEGDAVPTPYDYLAYPYWNIVPKPLEPGGLVPHSLNNSIGSFTLQDILEGKTPTITANYIGSTVYNFDLLSTYFGCVLTSGANAGVPEPCTLQFNGTLKASGKVVSESCAFAGTSLNPVMSLCTFPASFSGLESVSVIIKAGLATPLLTIPELDGVRYTVHFD